MGYICHVFLLLHLVLQIDTAHPLNVIIIVDLSLIMTLILNFLSVSVLKQAIVVLNCCWALQLISFLELLIIHCHSISLSS